MTRDPLSNSGTRPNTSSPQRESRRQPHDGRQVTRAALLACILTRSATRRGLIEYQRQRPRNVASAKPGRHGALRLALSSLFPNRTIGKHLHGLSGSSTLQHVPRVDAFSVAGLVLRFYSSDHLPPHFHAEKPGHWEVRVRFLRDPAQMIEVVTNKRPRAAELRKLKRLTVVQRVALLAEWEAKVVPTEPGADR